MLLRWWGIRDASDGKENAKGSRSARGAWEEEEGGKGSKKKRQRPTQALVFVFNLVGKERGPFERWSFVEKAADRCSLVEWGVKVQGAREGRERER